MLRPEFSEVKFFFVQTKNDQSEEFTVQGSDLFIKSDDSKAQKKTELTTNTAVASDWSLEQNNEQVFRQKKLYAWINKTFGSDCTFWFGTTITSLPSISTLCEIIKLLPSSNVYAGYPCLFPGKFLHFSNFVFASGSNSLLSYDLIQFLIEDTDVDYIGLPNDVWIGVRLSNIPRTVLPRFDIEDDSKILYEDLFSEKPLVLNKIKKAIEAGHYHFRVKSKGNRELVDHLILLEVYKLFSGGCVPKIENLVGLSRKNLKE